LELCRVPTRKRLLIVEDQALIALDIQRVMENAFGREALVVRSFEQAEPLVGSFGEFNLAVVTPPRSPGDRAIAYRLVQAGVAVVVCSAAMVDLSRTPLAGSPRVDKPFTDEDLLAACRAALAAKNVS
jgi:hypothetical protein